MSRYFDLLDSETRREFPSSYWASRRRPTQALVTSRVISPSATPRPLRQFDDSLFQDAISSLAVEHSSNQESTARRAASLRSTESPQDQEEGLTWRVFEEGLSMDPLRRSETLSPLPVRYSRYALPRSPSRSLSPPATPSPTSSGGSVEVVWESREERYPWLNQEAQTPIFTPVANGSRGMIDMMWRSLTTSGPTTCPSTSCCDYSTDTP